MRHYHVVNARHLIDGILTCQFLIGDRFDPAVLDADISHRVEYLLVGNTLRSRFQGRATHEDCSDWQKKMHPNVAMS